MKETQGWMLSHHAGGRRSCPISAGWLSPSASFPWPVKGPTRLSTAAQCLKPKSPQMFASALSFCSWQDVNFHPFISTALPQLQGLLEG